MILYKQCDLRDKNMLNKPQWTGFQVEREMKVVACFNFDGQVSTTYTINRQTYLVIPPC